MDDLDIEALLDAPLKSKLTKTLSSSSSSSRKDGREYHHKEHDRHRHYSRGRSRSPDNRHISSSAKVDPYKMPLSEAQRDRRTVFVRQLAQRVRSADLHAFFSRAGGVRDARLVYDRISGRSKGIGYVEFVDEQAVKKALAMNGERLCGIPVIVELTETEKNRLAEEAAEASRRQSNPAPVSSNYSSSFYNSTKVFVGGLHPSLGEPDIRRVFEPFGDIESVQMTTEGSAHIRFRTSSDAAMAVDQMNGFLLANRPIRVGILRERSDGTSTVQYGKVGEVFTSNNLDDSETQGLTLTAQKRADLMRKLARQDSDKQEQSLVKLTGMYNPSEETELHWEYSIADDVREECARFGKIVEIKVPKTAGGEVFVKFETQAAAQAAISALNGRWFAGSQITACLQP